MGRHRKPVQLPAHRCHMRKLGHERQESGNIIQDLLQLVSERLADSVEESIAAVNTRCYEHMDESLHHLLGEHTAEPTDVAQVDICTATDAVNLGLHIQAFVENNAQIACLVSGWNQTVSNTDARDGELPFLLR